MEGLEKPKTTIPLTGQRGAGRFLTIDLEDSGKMMSYRWTPDSIGRAYTYINGVMVWANRFILGIVTDKSLRVTVINDNPFDLRKSNLKVTATHPIPAHVKPGKAVSHKEGVYYGVSPHPGRNGKYSLYARDKSFGSTADKELAAFIVDVWRVYLMKSWSAAVKTGKMNFPEKKNQIFEALEKNEHLLFRYNSQKHADEKYFCVRPTSKARKAFFGLFEHDDKRHNTGSFPSELDAAIALYRLAVKKVGVKKAVPYMPPELFSEIKRVPIKKPSVVHVSKAVVVPPKPEHRKSTTNALLHTIAEAERQKLSPTPGLFEADKARLRATIERASTAAAAHIMWPAPVDEPFVDPGFSGPYKWKSREDFQKHVWEVLDLGYTVRSIPDSIHTIVDLTKIKA
jgi:hypothetical protein